MKRAMTFLGWIFLGALLSVIANFLVKNLFGETNFSVGAVIGGALAAYGATRSLSKQQE